jgi:hypothetical protein
MSEFDNPKRWQPPPVKMDAPEGRYTAGISNPNILFLYGSAVAQWTHIEELMIEVLQWLLFVDAKIIKEVGEKSRGHIPGSQIFRSVGTHNYRIKLMKNLLSRFIGNLKKDPLYDEIIDDFASLGGKRNDYVHSKWWTHESGRVFMRKQVMDDFVFGTKEEVKVDEFVEFFKKIQELQAKIKRLSEIEHRELIAELLASFAKNTSRAAR